MSNRDELCIAEPYAFSGYQGNIVITSGGKLALNPKKETFLWEHEIREVLSVPESRLHFLGQYNGQQTFTLELSAAQCTSLSAQLTGLRDYLGAVPEGLFRLLGRALQISDWNSAHKYCGYCGSQTELVSDERAAGCPDCHKIFYPRISPCVMALVKNGDKCLLARNAAWQEHRFSVIAGFIEPGESVEDAVHREVMEEVGVKVRNLEYINSQPWPFPGQLMLGFFADHDSGDIAVDGEEIAEAHWYHYDDLPRIPGEYSLSGMLIRKFIERQAGS